MADEELKESVQRIKLMEGQISMLQQQALALSNAVAEMSNTRSTLESMRGLEKESEALLPLGSGIFAHGTIGKQPSVLVDVGAGILVEKSPEEAGRLLDGREAEARKNLEGIHSLMGSIEKQYAETGRKIKELAGR